MRFIHLHVYSCLVLRFPYLLSGLESKSGQSDSGPIFSFKLRNSADSNYNPCFGALADHILRCLGTPVAQCSGLSDNGVPLHSSFHHHRLDITKMQLKRTQVIQPSILRCSCKLVLCLLSCDRADSD